MGWSGRAPAPSGDDAGMGQSAPSRLTRVMNIIGIKPLIAAIRT
jgi:hypothetical protein